MYRYLAIPSGFTNWLTLNPPKVMDEICNSVQDASESNLLIESVHTSETFRATRSDSGELLIFWNTDYLDYSGVVSWSFVALDVNFGIFRIPGLSKAATTRFLHLTDKRFNQMSLPDHWCTRSHGDNYKTCKVGNNRQPSKHSLAYWEGNVSTGLSSRYTLICTGPDDGPISNNPLIQHERAVAHCKDRVSHLSKLIIAADSTLTKASTKPACKDKSFIELDKSIKAPASSQLDPGVVESLPQLSAIEEIEGACSYGLTYDDWIREGSPLGRAQRKILESDSVGKLPLRICGPAGSGKTLLMQLLTMKFLFTAQQEGRDTKCLYVCHNASMQEFLIGRFEYLGAKEFLLGEQQSLDISTLAEYCSKELAIVNSELIDSDAAETKSYQRNLIVEFLTGKADEVASESSKMPIISMLYERSDLVEVACELIIHEIGTSIKGHSLIGERNRYVENDMALSRLHGELNKAERGFVFDAFENYYQQTTEQGGMLDSDDLAITLLSKLRSPLWNIRRRKEGVDLLFVDETQLFNENERRLFSYLPRKHSESGHLPIVLALDEAQELKGAVSAGFGLLGIDSIVNEQLKSVYRCTPSIVRLAFCVIQHTTDLFGADFPDFTESATSLIADNHNLARKPMLRIGGANNSLGNYIAKRAKSLRDDNLRSVCIVVHAEKYWQDSVNAVKTVMQEDPYILKRRGDVFGVNRPGVVLATPENVGGQEFDAVIAVGLEDGLIPPNVSPESFAESLKQRAMREMYLVFTRARYRVEVVISVNSSVTKVLQPAIDAGYLEIA